MKITAINQDLHYSGVNRIVTAKNPNIQKVSSSNFELPSAKFYTHVLFKGIKNQTPQRSEILEVVKTQAPLSNDGLKGVVYKFEKNGNAYAIKVGRASDVSFEKEAEVLKKLPKELCSSQKFVDYFKDQNGNDVLVSTFATGKKGVLSSKADFEKFFGILNALDSAGVLHGDLNMANCLFDNADCGKINIIDYGEGDTFRQGEVYDELYPNFVTKSNIINLEHNGIPDCIQKWSATGAPTKEIFRQYLSAKADFYGHHANMLENLSRSAHSTDNLAEAIEYEKNLASVLKNPSDKVLENEIKRINTLYAFENADTSVNYTKYPDDAIKNWNNTVNLSKESLDFICKQLANTKISAAEKKYFEFQQKLVGSLNKNFTQWAQGTTEWIKGLDTKPKNKLSEHERELQLNKGKTTGAVPNLVQLCLN